MAIIQLKSYCLFEISGEEAEKYLQGQLTSDVTKLIDGASTISVHCDPKGKTTSVFRVIRLSAQQFYLVLHKDLLPVAIDQLKKYAVFSKVSFNQLDLPIYGTIDEDNDFSAQIVAKFANRQILIDPENIQANANEDLWLLTDIQQYYPILNAKTQGEFIPQALNLQYLEQAISFQKGCYIGQETVARAKYRGANKRAMFVFTAQTNAAVEIGSEVEMQLENSWRKTGIILSAVYFEQTLWLQIVLAKDIPPQKKFRLTNTDIELNLQPLPYNLED